MKNLLYIGNKLAAKGATATSVDFLSKNLKAEGYVIKTASSKKNKVWRLADMLFLVFSNSKKTDIVLIDTYSTKNFWYAYAVAKLCKSLNLDYVPILHGGNLPERLEKNPAASNFLFGNAYINVAPSYYLYNVFKEFGFSNLEYIPNSIELNNYTFFLRKKLKPKLLWVRSFAHIYNPMLALLVLEELIKHYPNAELCMVGPAKDNSYMECKDYVEKKSLPVTFTGKMEKQEWIALSKEYHLFINTTNFDNTPVSVIEAMALGLPIVSTNVGGLPQLIDNSQDGILVPPNDPLAFVFQIEKLLADPNYSQGLAEAARTKVSAFDWDVVKYKWHSILS